MTRECLIFYRSFWEEILELGNEEEQYLFLKAILRYAFEGQEPTFQRGTDKAFWLHLKFDIDRTMSNYETKKQKGKGKEKDIDRDKEKDKEKELDKDENNIFKEKEKKKEDFCKEVFAIAGYSKHHLQSFVDYYTQPLQDNPERMLYETYKTWNLRMKLAAWKAPAPQLTEKSSMTLKTVDEIRAERKADDDAERQRIIDTVEAYKKNPGNKRLSELVRMMQQNGTLKKYGIRV